MPANAKDGHLYSPGRELGGVWRLVVEIKRMIPRDNPHPPSLRAGSPLSRGTGEGLEFRHFLAPRPHAGEGADPGSQSGGRRVRASRYAPLAYGFCGGAGIPGILTFTEPR